MLRRFVMLALLAAVFVARTTSRADEPLRVGILPYEAADKVRENWRPFADYLGKRVGREVTVYIGTDYVGLIEAMRAKKIELIMLSPLPYVIASNQMKLIPLFTPLEIKEKGKRGSPFYRGVIITRSDSGIKDLKDLKGKKMAFVDPASTSGHLYPVDLLMRNGIDPQKDLKMEYYAGNADSLVNAVFDGKCDAGALYKGGMERVLKAESKINQMKVLAETRDIPSGVMSARGDLPKSLVEKIRKAIVDLDQSGDCERICGPFMVNGWIPAKDEAFDGVRKVARVLKLELKAK